VGLGFLFADLSSSSSSSSSALQSCVGLGLLFADLWLMLKGCTVFCLMVAVVSANQWIF
jgi:hypothetical protein